MPGCELNEHIRATMDLALDEPYALVIDNLGQDVSSAYAEIKKADQRYGQGFRDMGKELLSMMQSLGTSDEDYKKFHSMRLFLLRLIHSNHFDPFEQRSLV